MAKKRKLEKIQDCRTAKEVNKYLAGHEKLVGMRNGKGSHIVYEGRTGKVTAYYFGNKQYPKGTMRSIVKMAVRAGLGVLALVVLMGAG